MFDLIRLYASGACEDIVKKSQLARMDCLGSLGSTIFYGDGYMATLHRDQDVSWSASSQLGKVSLVDEYNFALVEWGIFFITYPGCIW